MMSIWILGEMIMIIIFLVILQAVLTSTKKFLTKCMELYKMVKNEQKKYVSPYLLKPLRTLEQVLEQRKKKSN